MKVAPSDRLGARTLFVVGKGGVGKTTTAAALALHFADRDQSTHLVSVDPAHNLSDVFGQPFPQAAPTSCNRLLTAEEFVADAYADAWIAAARPALIEVAERGTYLDAADAKTFLDLSMPGVDEVMAALRLVELLDIDATRIVVDTAPTGHLLRLLRAGALLESWADALDAMVQKADAVSIGMVGQTPEWGARRMLQQWRDHSRVFEQLTRDAQFVVVTRGDAVVESETNRLRAELRAAQLQTAVVIANAQPSASADWYAPPASPRPTGCEGLRTWVDSLQTPQTHLAGVSAASVPGALPRGGAARSLPGNAWLDAVAPPMLLIAGKGGVGKSTIASAIALLRAESQPTCLISTDPAGSLGDVLDLPVGAEANQQLPGLTVWQLDADAEFERLRARYADEVREAFERLGLDGSVQLDRAVIDKLWQLAPPGLDEIVALTELTSATERCPSIVLDSAPTGHFLRLMQLPELAVDWSHALMRVLLKYHVAGALENFTAELLAFTRRSRQLHEDLITPGKAAAVLVTLDEPVVWAETTRLHEALRRAKIPVAALVVNRADEGPLRGRPTVDSTVLVIRTPNLETSPIGAEALRAFTGRWEVLT